VKIPDFVPDITKSVNKQSNCRNLSHYQKL
jgi:hypothetical protein